MPVAFVLHNTVRCVARGVGVWIELVFFRITVTFWGEANSSLTERPKEIKVLPLPYDSTINMSTYHGHLSCPPMMGTINWSTYDGHL